MSLELNKVHNYRSVAGTKQVRLESTNPYLRLCQGSGPPLFIQRGMVYSEGSQRIKKADLPEWFQEELDKVSKAILNEVGWKTENTESKNGETSSRVESSGFPKTPRRGRPPKKDVTDGDDQRSV